MRAHVDVRRIATLGCALALLVTLVRAAAAQTVPAPLSESPDIASVDAFELDNGLRVYLARPRHTALMSEALLVVKAGTEYGPRVFPADVAWLTAEALFAGPMEGSEESIRHFLARSGISMDFTVGREVAVFRFSIPTFQTIPFVHFLASLLNRREISEAAWKDAVERRRRMLAGQKTDLWQHSTRMLDSLAWHGVPEPVLAQQRLAEVSGLAEARRSGFRAAAYTPRRMVFSLWGEFPIETLRLAIHQQFSRLAPVAQDAPELAARPRPEPVPAGRPLTRCFEAPGADPPALFVGLSARVEDDFTFYGWQVLAQILGASDVSRLHQRMRIEENLTYTVEASCVMVGANGLTLRVVGQTDQLQRARQIILEEIGRLQREEVTQQELDTARAILHSRLLLDDESLRERFYRRSLSLLASERVRNPAGAEKVLAELTPRRLLEMARATLRPDEAVTIVVSTRSEPLCATPGTPRPAGQASPPGTENRQGIP